MGLTEEEVLLHEYIVCNDKAHSYMSVCWQIGAILISASILMLSASVQVFPNPLGALLILIALITLHTWYKIFERINWICHNAYDRAKAIEVFMQTKYGIKPLKYTRNENETIDTTTINSWINNLDNTLNSPSATKSVKILLWTLIGVSLFILMYYMKAIFFVNF